MIGPLTDPAAFGGDPADAFDVVVPSLPGFGFSTPLKKTGDRLLAHGRLWVTLMRDVLGYERFAAQGGDWGALVDRTARPRARRAPDRRAPEPGHAARASSRAASGRGGLRPRRAERTARDPARMADTTSHVAVQGTDPQTLAYALHDSPGRPVRVAPRAPPQLERLRRRRRAPLLQGRPDHHHDALLGHRELRDLGALLLGGRTTPGARPTTGRPWSRRRRAWRSSLASSSSCRSAGCSYYNLQPLIMPAGGHFAPMEEPERWSRTSAFFRPLGLVRLAGLAVVAEAPAGLAPEVPRVDAAPARSAGPGTARRSARPAPSADTLDDVEAGQVGGVERPSAWSKASRRPC